MNYTVAIAFDGWGNGDEKMWSTGAPVFLFLVGKLSSLSQYTSGGIGLVSW
jgi:hypothetical protein